MSNLTDFTLTLVVVYWIYLAIVAISLVISLFILYHLIRFGFFSLVNLLSMIIYLALLAWLLWYSFTLLQTFDWTIPIFSYSNLYNIGNLSNLLHINVNIAPPKL